MSKFLIRRLLLGILIVFLGSLVYYAVIRCLPTSFVEAMARQFAAATNGRKTYKEWLDELNAVYGMNIGVLGGSSNGWEMRSGANSVTRGST